MITQLLFSFLLRMILFSLFVLFVVSISFVKISVSHGWDVLMFFNPLDLFHNYVEEAVTHYLDLIRGNHPEAFTCSRKVSLSKLLFKMTDRHVLSQQGEVDTLFREIGRVISVKDFFEERNIFNPEAVHVMADGFITQIYDNFDDSIQKWNDLIILGVDGTLKPPIADRRTE